jgi:hypothetical protein
MIEVDFVIPICKNNIIIRTTIESVIYNYSPRCIYIITNSTDKEILEESCKKWELSKTHVIVLDENSFFMKTYNLSRADISKWYTWKDTNSREFGWWFQQILKLGAFLQIENLSDPYVVWDSDLIVLDKWELFPYSSEHPRFAILQEFAKNEFNRTQYAGSIKHITGLDVIEPSGGGTFVPHHFIFHHRILQNMIQYIELTNICEIDNKNWMQYIIELSSKYYRFSEYKCVATYMNTFFPEQLQYYAFHEYGKNGIRYREPDSSELIQQIQQNLLIIDEFGISRIMFMHFVNNHFDIIPSYIQIEHVS